MNVQNISMIGIVAMGDYDASATYNTLQAVRYNGKLYLATQPSTGIVPDSNDGARFWMEAASDGSDFDDIEAGEVAILQTEYTATPITFTVDGEEFTTDIFAANGNESANVIENTITISPDAWEGASPYRQTISVPGVTADSINFITIPYPSPPTTTMNIIHDANFGDGGQRDGEITILCYGITPPISLTLKITIFQN